MENTKIKSKWKAQKRKEAASAALKDTEPQGSSDEEGNESDDVKSEPELVKEEPKPKVAEKPVPKKSSLHPSRAHIHPELAPKPSRKRQREEEEAAAASEPTSLRDLTREAYSRTSLHTFKRSTARGAPRGRGRGRGDARGGGAPRGETGRGQPNMKLRMDAMLAKIKQDLA